VAREEIKRDLTEWRRAADDRGRSLGAKEIKKFCLRLRRDKVKECRFTLEGQRMPSELKRTKEGEDTQEENAKEEEEEDVTAHVAENEEESGSEEEMKEQKEKEEEEE
jgi:uncharacterized membrane protein YukC